MTKQRELLLFGAFTYLGALLTVLTSIVVVWEDIRRNHLTVFHAWFPPAFRIAWVLFLVGFGSIGTVLFIKHLGRNVRINGTNQTAWIILLIFFLPIGWLLYYHLVVRKQDFAPNGLSQPNSSSGDGDR